MVVNLDVHASMKDRVLGELNAVEIVAIDRDSFYSSRFNQIAS